MRSDAADVSRSQFGRADLVRVLCIPDPTLRELALAAFAERTEVAPETLSLGVPIRVAAREVVAAQSTAEPPPKLNEAFHWCPVGFSLRDDADLPQSPQRPSVAASPPPRRFSTEFAPLIDATNLLTAIRRATVGWKTTTELDATAVVDRVSRCTLVDPIPYRRRRSWGPEIFVVVDESPHLAPFGHDVDAVVATLADIYPNDGIEIARRRGQELERSNSLGADRMPRPGIPVLAITDLGCLADSGNAPTDAFRLRWGRRFRERGNPTLALVPTSPSRVAAPLREVWSVIPWGAGGAAAADRDEAWARLLRLISPAVRLEVGLLRAFRRLLPECRNEPGWESLVWQSDLLSSRHIRGATLDPLRRRKHLDEFARLPLELRRDAIALLEAWHGKQFPMLCATSVISLPSEAFADLDCGSIRRAKEAILRFAETHRKIPYSDSAKLWAVDLRKQTGERTFADRQLKSALNEIHRAAATEGEALGEAPRWYDPRDPATPTDTAETTIEVREVDGRLEFAPIRGGSSFPVGERAGSPLTTIRSRNGEIVLDDADPFWDSGQAPAWASAWGVDGYGRWAEFTFGGATQRMRWIEPGTFRMGSPHDEEGRFNDEEPVHQVTITRGYWLFDTPCCQDLWEAVLGPEANRSRFRGSRRPVESVSWEEAVAFLDRLNDALPGLAMRLPREAEWEYACRAGTSTSRHGPLDEIAWHRGNSGRTTHDVGAKRANAWGLHEMLGNVYEWCLDGKRRYSKESVVDPDGGGGADRVVRGGCWDRRARSVRAASRGWDRIGGRHGLLGFRALSSGASPAPGGRVRIRYLRQADPDARDSASVAPKTPILVQKPVTVALPTRHAFQLQSDVETCDFERIPKPSWASDFGRDRYGLWCTLEVGGVVQRMRWIPPGRFMMGSPPEEEGRYPHEGPMHPVLLTAGYWLFDTPCTQALWSAVMNGDNPSRFRDPMRPVEKVSYDAVTTFLDTINRTVGGLGLKLPTEAQWEYACRAGTTTATYAGDLKIRGENDAPILHAIAWYGGNSGHEYDLEKGADSSDWPKKQYQHTKAGTRRVATKDPNGWWLYDMLGNVWEWCADFQREYTDSVAVDPVGERGAGRVVRGGGWAFRARTVRAADRYWSRPDARDVYLGFRALSSGASSGKAGRDASG